MSAWLIIAVGFIYLYVAAEQSIKGNFGIGMAYAGYAFANFGLYMVAAK